MKARIGILALIVLLVGAPIGYWIFSHLEKGSYEESVGFQGEARYNDFLMAQRFLEKSGSKAKSLWHLPTEADLKDLDAVLLPHRGRRLSPAQAEALLAFVERGGFLMAEGAWSEQGEGLQSQDPIFAAFGARKRFHRPESKEGEEPLNADRGAPKAARVWVHGQTFRLELERWSVLEHHGDEPRAAIDDGEGTKLLVFHRGKGEAVLCNGLGFLDNVNLPKADHAPFLAAVMAGRKGAAIVVREEAPSLRQWLLEHAPLPMAALGLLIALALWRALPRFGPMIPDPSPDRRSLLEHLAACGRFQWRHRDGRSLLLASREALMARVLRVHPGWAALPPDQLCAQLAAFSGVPEPAVFKALRYDTHPDARDFLDALQTLDFLRKKL